MARPKAPPNPNADVQDGVVPQEEMSDLDRLPQDEMPDPFTNLLHSVDPGPEESKIPEDIRAVLEECGLGEDGRTYRCILKDITDSNNTALAAYIDSYANKVPSYDEVAKLHGPGDYLYVFMWQEMDDNGRKKLRSKNVRFRISEKFRDLYEENLIKRMEERASRKRQLVRSAKLKAAIENGVDAIPAVSATDPEADAERFLERHAKINALLGIAPPSVPSAPAAPSVNWPEVLKAGAMMLAPVMTYIIERSKSSGEEARRTLETIIQVQQKNADQTIALLGKRDGPSTGTELMKEVMQMVMGAVDLKKALSDREETVADKIFDTIQGVLPVILAMSASKGAGGAAAAQAYLAANPELRQLQDPGIRKEVIRKFDSTIGWEQTDMLLRIAGMERPDDCPRDDAQQHPSGTREPEPEPETIDA